jgi:hypothetical protein
MIRFSKLYYFLAIFLVSPILILQNTGCTKEYSYEGGDTTVVINNPPADSTLSPQDTSGLFPICNLCKIENPLNIGDWSFKTGNSFLCGGTTNSGFFGGNTQEDITFFGPSACSVDTGIVVSAFFSVPLDRDRFNITAYRAAFYYYDNNAPKDIFMSHQENIFTVTIQSFIYSTRIASGIFSGTVFKANGDTANIKEGKFKVHIK